MRRTVLALALLASACTSSGGDAKPSSTSPASPSASASVADAYTALTPPKSPGIGDVESIIANRAYANAQGLLAEALLEQGTVTGADAAQVATDLSGTSGDTGVRAALRGTTAAGLDYRPLFGPGVTVPASGFAEVVRSTWGGEEAQGRGGEKVLRITWDGAIRYRVQYQGKPVEVAYALKTAWIYQTDTGVAGEIAHITTLRGTSHIAPQPPACTQRGVIVPAGPAPVEADFTSGPYPTDRSYPAGCPGLTK